MTALELINQILELSQHPRVGLQATVILSVDDACATAVHVSRAPALGPRDCIMLSDLKDGEMDYRERDSWGR